MSSIAAWPSAAESWLDRQGKAAWIAAMVLGFILFWPIGLTLLFYMIWSNRMCARDHTCNFRRRHRRQHRMPDSGNSAFDAYKTDTLRRLEDEQDQFQGFLQRLRDARDKAEFDQFMAEQRERGTPSRPDNGDTSAA